MCDYGSFSQKFSFCLDVKDVAMVYRPSCSLVFKTRCKFWLGCGGYGNVDDVL